MANEDYLTFIGKGIEEIAAHGIVAIRDDLRTNPKFGGYGGCEERGCRLLFDLNLQCISVLIAFDCINSHDFNGLNYGSTMNDAAHAFGDPDMGGWIAVKHNWFIPERCFVFSLGPLQVEAIGSLVGKRLKRISIEKAT